MINIALKLLMKKLNNKPIENSQCPEIKYWKFRILVLASRGSVKKRRIHPKIAKTGKREIPCFQARYCQTASNTL